MSQVNAVTSFGLYTEIILSFWTDLLLHPSKKKEKKKKKERKSQMYRNGSVLPDIYVWTV